MDLAAVTSLLASYGPMGLLAAALLLGLAAVVRSHVRVTDRYIARLEASDDRNTRALEALEGAISTLGHKQALQHAEVMAKVETTGLQMAVPLERASTATLAAARAAEQAVGAIRFQQEHGTSS